MRLVKKGTVSGTRKGSSSMVRSTAPFLRDTEERLLFIEGQLMGIYNNTTDVGVKARIKLIFNSAFPEQNVKNWAKAA